MSESAVIQNLVLATVGGSTHSTVSLIAATRTPSPPISPLLWSKGILGAGTGRRRRRALGSAGCRAGDCHECNQHCGDADSNHSHGRVIRVRESEEHSPAGSGGIGCASTLVL